MRRGCVILANGDFPRRGGKPWRLLAEARLVVACDGAAVTYRRRFGRWPDIVIGDMDSIGGGRLALSGVTLVVREDPSTNDLSKAIHYCRAQGWRDLVVVGAAGRREDHAIGNVFRALEEGVPVVSDYGEFRPVCGKVSFRCRKGAGVSVFAPDPKTRMTSRGLVWPLDGVRFRNLYCATLNRAAGRSFSVTADRTVFVYIADS